jgi:hypothetical protein
MVQINRITGVTGRGLALALTAAAQRTLRWLRYISARMCRCVTSYGWVFLVCALHGVSVSTGPVVVRLAEKADYLT